MLYIVYKIDLKLSLKYTYNITHNMSDINKKNTKKRKNQEICKNCIV